MNAGPDVERLISGWLADQAPGRAPDRLVGAAVRVVDRTNQRRLAAAWREPMYVTMRGLLAAALVGVVAIGGAILILNGKPTATVGASPTPGTVSSAVPTAAGDRPIANGRYLASIPVADIMQRLAADTTMTAEEKSAVTNGILGIVGATTLHVEIRITDTTFKLAFNPDDHGGSDGPAWNLYVLDATTIALDIGNAGNNIQAYAVRRAGNTFTLEPRSAAPTATEAFVRSVLYQSAPFEPAT